MTQFWTTLVTVLSGVLVYVLGQLVLKLMIEPVQNMNRTIGAISHALNEYQPVISNPGVTGEERESETSRALRKLSAELESHLFLIPLYSFTTCLFRLPSHDRVRNAASFLIGLSNGLSASRNPKIYEINAASVEKICDALGIYMHDNDRISKVYKPDE